MKLKKLHLNININVYLHVFIITVNLKKNVENYERSIACDRVYELKFEI